MLVPDAGSCKAFQTRYYFDRAADQCKEFIYGGCRGNENNFETLENCQNACKPSKVACPYHSCTPESLKCPTGSGLATNQNGCLLCECEGKKLEPKAGFYFIPEFCFGNKLTNIHFPLRRWFFFKPK